jgi:hypothetical protein
MVLFFFYDYCKSPIILRAQRMYRSSVVRQTDAILYRTALAVISVVAPGFSPARAALKGGATSTTIFGALHWSANDFREQFWIC